MLTRILVKLALSLLKEPKVKKERPKPINIRPKYRVRGFEGMGIELCNRCQNKLTTNKNRICEDCDQ